MRTVVVDASIVAKWLVPEDLSSQALALRGRYDFAAPDLLHAELANILWKKVRRGEISEDEALAGLHVFAHAEFLLEKCETLIRQALQLACQIDHPAYDCFYLCLAAKLDTVLVTADDRLLRRLAASSRPEWASVAVDVRTF